MSSVCTHCGEHFDPSSLDEVRYHHNVPHRPIAATGIGGVEVIEVKPALAPQDWQYQPNVAALRNVDYDVFCTPSEGVLEIRVREGDHWATYAFGHFGGEIQGLMALANAALPDNHTNKLTWELVDAIRESAVHAENGGMYVSAIYAAADRIAALLPPRE